MLIRLSLERELMLVYTVFWGCMAKTVDHDRNNLSCICENKGADQLCSNCTADQRLCFRGSFDVSSFQCGSGGCLIELCLQLAIIMAGKQFIQNNLLEIVLP